MLSSKPSQYIKGWVEFYKLRFKVTPDVLIPRPETELIVDEVINYTSSNNKSFTLLDVGTGAGNIAISIAKNLPKAKIFATDVSFEALEIAKENAKFHRMGRRIFFLQSDLLENIKNCPDVLVTNLPYIPEERIPYLDSSVKDFEPHIALDGGLDGFELYRKLFKQIKEKGWKPRLIVGEIDYTHGELAIQEALKYFPKAQAEVKTDLAHKQRILKVTFAGSYC